MFKTSQVIKLNKLCGYYIYIRTKDKRLFSTNEYYRNISKTTINNGDDSEHLKKNSIFKASLPFVNKYGWTVSAIEEGAKSLSLHTSLYEEVDFVHYFYKDCNKGLINLMEKDGINKETPFLFVHNAMETRLRMIIPYISRWKEALGIMANSRKKEESLSILLKLIDDICCYAGDKPEESPGFFIRRIGLATIYRITELELIEDKSLDYQNTWQYLNERLTEAITIRKDLQDNLGKTMNWNLDEFFQIDNTTK